MGATCTVDGCDRTAQARGWCSRHYGRWQRHGDPLAGGTPNGVPLAWLTLAAAFTTDECILWPFAKDNHGYGRINAFGCSRAHHVSLILAGRPLPGPGEETRHTCGRGAEGCVNERHLVNGTRTENVADSRAHGTIARGETNGRAVLTVPAVRVIRASSASAVELAEIYGVSPCAIWDVRRGRTWRHVA